VVPRRARETERKTKKRRGGALAFLLAGALPAAAVVWFFLQPAEQRQALLDKIPSGVGGRALTAAIAFGVMLVLAFVALPAFHGTSGALRGILARLRAKPLGVRILLFPVEAVVWVVWFLAQMLFAVDAVLVLAAGLATLLLVLRIVKPDLLPGLLPELTR
jgi:hypothetical protein